MRTKGRTIWAFCLALALAAFPVSAFAEMSPEEVEQAYKDGSDTGASDLAAEVAGVSSMADGTIRGVDLTSYQAERAAGVSYRNFSGDVVDDAGFMQLLKTSGVNYVLLRVAVDPADSEGNTYGGGDPTLENAAATAALAQANGIAVNIQFMFSDFNTSKTSQLLPKGWPADAGALEEKVSAYVKESLNYLSAQGVAPEMVTLGSEIQDTFLGQTDWADICSLISAASKQVRACTPKAEIVAGFGNVTPSWIATYADVLKYYGVDYDAIGTKVYPAYDDTDELAQSRVMVNEEYGKKLVVLGVSYPYTPYDSDGYLGDDSATELASKGLEISPQGQASYVRGLYKAVVSQDNNEGAGVFYGDAAWIAVKPGSWYWDENHVAAEKYGTGWIASAAAEYTPDGEYPNNNNQEQMALFDTLGKPLQSLKMFGQLAAENTKDVDLVPEAGDPYETGADTGAAQLPASVEPIATVTDDTIRGADVSSYQALYEAGVTFKNYDGKEEPLFKILANNGMNWVRLRLYVDPFDSEGHAYGSGVCDLKTVTTMAKEATQYGLTVLLDIHYNDFNASSWRVPKAWRGHNLDQLKKDVYDYTKNVMETLVSEGVDLGMVQIGNESNSGMLGVIVGSDQDYATDPDWKNLTDLMNEASRAIRETSPSTKIAIHFMYAWADTVRAALQNFKTYGLDYDVYGTTYYPFWSSGSDGTDAQTDPMGALVKLERMVTEEFGKEFAVVEFSYPYTDKDSDGQPNNVGGPDEDSNTYPYELSPQGQADVIHDTFEAVTGTSSLGLGAFWWEPAWLAVVPGTNHWQINKIYANDHATGWASSYAQDNDPGTTEYEQWGGSGWDNQALFDTRGYPLQSLKAFRQIVGGKSSEVRFSDVNAETPHYEDIMWMAREGLAEGWEIEGSTYREFRGMGSVVRQDMAAFLHRLAEYEGADIPLTKDLSFIDVTDKTPHADDIRWLAATGIAEGWPVNGGGREYRGMSEIVRQDMAAFLYRLAGSPEFEPSTRDLNYFADVDENTPHYKEVLWLAHVGVAEGWLENGTRTFRGMDTIKRQDMAAFLHRMSEQGLIG